MKDEDLKQEHQDVDQPAVEEQTLVEETVDDDDAFSKGFNRCFIVNKYK